MKEPIHVEPLAVSPDDYINVFRLNRFPGDDRVGIMWPVRVWYEPIEDEE